MLIIPEEVQIAQQIEDQLEKINRLRERHSWLRHFDQELKKLDPRLSLVKATENPSQWVLKPGCWHIKRDNEGAIPTYIPLLTDDGRFREPLDSDLEMLRRNDMRRSGWFRELAEAQERQRIDRENEKWRQREARIEEFADRLTSLERPSVGYAKKWTNSTRGRRESH